MCLGIPMKVIEITGEEGVASAGGLKRKANFSLMKDIKIGDYVLIHAGFAIEKIKDKEAKATLKVLRDIE